MDMKYILNSRYIMSLAILMLVGLMVACNEDEVAKTSEVQLLSFGPTGAKPGEQISFIGTNLNKVTAISLTGATVEAASFISQTDELIVLKVPLETGKGLVTLKTPAGDIVSKTILSFEVLVKIDPIPTEAKPGENIKITGDYLQWIEGVTFAKDTTVIKFVSQSIHELVVKVPFGAQTGTLVFIAGGTEPISIESETELKVKLPVLKTIAPIPAVKGKNITITGVDLDLTMGILFKGFAAPVTNFVSKTPTEIVVKVPEKANKGKIALVAYSGIQIESENTLSFVGDLPDLDPVAYALYEDGLVNKWQNWGWGSTVDFASSDNVRDGKASAKIKYEGTYGAVKFANVSLDLSKFMVLTFSLFGTDETDGKVINIVANGGKPFQITIKKGVWMEYKITIKELGSPKTLTDLVFQDSGWAGTIYLDHVGFN